MTGPRLPLLRKQCLSVAGLLVLIALTQAFVPTSVSKIKSGEKWSSREMPVNCVMLARSVLLRRKLEHVVSSYVLMTITPRTNFASDALS